jgi:murein DD-endopeptidase MepM/ murein hydrolase activator NlpD
VRARHTVSALLMAVALTAGALGPASADVSNDQIQNQINGAQQDLEDTSARLQAAAADLAQAREELPAARAQYQATASQLLTARHELVAIRERLQALAAQQRRVGSQITQARKRIESSQVLIGRLARYLYQTGGFSELQIVLAAESPGDLVDRLMTTDSITDSQTSVIDQMTADKAVFTARQQELAVTQDAIQTSKSQIQAKVADLSQLAASARKAQLHLRSLISLRAHALTVAKQERASDEARLARLKAAQAALQQQIGQQTSTGGGLPNGQLSDPVPGAPMVQGVGWRVHPVYGYRSCHTGIDLAAAIGTPILAARSGTVVWTRADLSGPYGNNTLIDHGDGLSTFYAHQSAFNVTPGEHVKTGQVIGYVGATGWVTGPHLHFEVHINGVPYDPMGWFGGTKRPESVFCP